MYRFTFFMVVLLVISAPISAFAQDPDNLEQVEIQTLGDTITITNLGDNILFVDFWADDTQTNFLWPDTKTKINIGICQALNGTIIVEETNTYVTVSCTFTPFQFLHF